MYESFDKFLGMENAVTCKVKIHYDSGKQSSNVPMHSLASHDMRSLELLWDKNKRSLDAVLAAEECDIDAYVTQFSALYPEARYDKPSEDPPKWFSPNLSYHRFGVSWTKHDYTPVVDSKNEPVFIPHLARIMQQNEYCWIQFVFFSRDLSDQMRAHREWLEYGNASENKYQYIKDNYSILSNDAQFKESGPHILMSIRGLCDFGYAGWKKHSGNDGSQSNDGIGILPFKDITSKHGNDHMTCNRYPWGDSWTLKRRKIKVNGITKKDLMWHEIFNKRLVPDPAAYKNHRSQYFMTLAHNGRKTNTHPQYLILANGEASTFLRLPDHETPNIAKTYEPKIRPPPLSKTGFNMGFSNRVTAEEFDLNAYYEMFGCPVDSIKAKALTASASDFSRHVYVLGPTGSGKSSIIKCFAKHLEMANIYASMPRDVTVDELRTEGFGHLRGLDMTKTLDELGVGFENAFIYFDPKGDDSEMLIRACEKESFKNGRIRYLDPDKTGFAINPMELPPHELGDRDKLVSMYAGHVSIMLGEWFGDSNTFVRLHLILDTVIAYLYVNNDSPTFVDLCDMIELLRSSNDPLRRIYGEMGKPTEELDAALKTISDMDSQSFDSALSRLTKFKTDKLLRNMFCTRHSTMSFADLIKPGAHTVVRFSESNVPSQALTLAIQAFVLKLWFEVLERSNRTDIGSRTQVILALDEFQKLQGMDILDDLIAQARSKGLGLILSHQNLTQINDSLLRSITGNFGLQMAGRINGSDALRLCAGWDIKNTDENAQWVSKQPNYNWVAHTNSRDGSSTEVSFWTHFDHDAKDVLRSNISDYEWDQFVRDEKTKYGAGLDTRGIMQSNSEWKKHLQLGFVDKDEWTVLCALRNGPRRLAGITPDFKGRPRDDVSSICQRMADQGMLEKVDDRGTLAESRSPHYQLSKAGRDYFSIHSDKVGKASDVHETARHAFESYLSRKHFVGLARQELHKGTDLTDYVAYDYDTNTPISVEIESKSEVDSHPEQVVKNMTKWPAMGFGACHVWSPNPKISEILEKEKIDAAKGKEDGIHGAEERLATLDRVRVFVIEPDGGSAPHM